MYGEGNTGPFNAKKRKSAGSDDKKSAADIDFKVLEPFSSLLKCASSLCML